MLIRCRGYNNGVKEYLEEGVKSGRDHSRDELDERIILDGDLALTKMVYQSIPDKGQDRYLSFTLSFREDHISEHVLKNISDDFKSFMMSAYRKDEFNYYAEAHIPKIKCVQDKLTGEMIERKPHIHIVIPKINLLSGKIFEAVGSSFSQSEPFLEAFQESVNQKYGLASPREHVRVDPTNAASILSRFKGDDFLGRHREFKVELIKKVVSDNIRSRDSFYSMVGTFGETKIRNKGRENEYLAVKLPGDAKFTNLKETIFQDSFIVDRQLKKEPLPSHVVNGRLAEWPVRAKEIKYISKATPSFRKYYADASEAEKTHLLADREQAFYGRYRTESVFGCKWQGDFKPRAVKDTANTVERVGVGVQDLSPSHVASSGEPNPVLLQDDIRLHMGDQQASRDPGLRRPVYEQRGGGGRFPPGRGGNEYAGKSTGKNTRATGTRPRISYGRARSGINTCRPPLFRGSRVPTLAEVQRRSDQLFGKQQRQVGREAQSPLYRSRPVISGRDDSTLPAWLLRRYEHSLLSPEQRVAIEVVQQDFFERRRELMADNRLSAQEKQQRLSVMKFEFLKSKQAIEQPEEVDMGSAEIRAMRDRLDPKVKPAPDNSISAGPESTRDRIRREMNDLKQKVSPEAQQERAKWLDANQIYTKQSRQGHVHYVSKETNKTLFVDTGKAICLRRSGMEVGAVGVALELAIGRFGTTLDIKGGKDFKAQVVEAAATLALDVHFIDKAMNEALAERKAQLEEERTAAKEQDVEQEPEPVNGGKEHHVGADTDKKADVFKGILQECGRAPYRNDPKQSESFFIVLKTDTGTRTLWGAGLEKALQEKNAQVGQAVVLEDLGTTPVTIREPVGDGTFVDRVSHRREWRAEVESGPVQGHGPSKRAQEMAEQVRQLEKEKGRSAEQDAEPDLDV
jgi:hypothetical protein